MNRSKRNTTTFGALATLALLAVGPAPAGGANHCVRAQVPGSFVMPDGTEHEAGTLRICMNRQYSPVAGLHEMSADGGSTRMYISRMQTSEGVVDDATPYVMFRRNGGGSLVLTGYAVPDGDRYLVFRMESIANRQVPQQVPLPNALVEKRTDENVNKVVLLAALID